MQVYSMTGYASVQNQSANRDGGKGGASGLERGAPRAHQRALHAGVLRGAVGGGRARQGVGLGHSTG